MSFIPEASNLYHGVFIRGLLYGLVVCTASHLCYIASHFACVGTSLKGGAVTSFLTPIPLAGYALIVGLIGLLSGLGTAFSPVLLIRGILVDFLTRHPNLNLRSEFQWQVQEY